MALMPFSGFAAGLGKLNVSTGLGEPLKAEIELLSVSPEELSTLVAAIASEEAYATQGITRLGIHNSIKVEVAKAGDGSPILKLRSNQPISDPYLDMLIQVDWASGRLQREYTVLLDPPGYKQAPDNPAPMMVTPPSTAKSNNAMNSSVIDEKQGFIRKLKKYRRNLNSVTPTNSSKSSTPPISAENSIDSIQYNSDQTLTTKRGDTLSSIAKQMQIEGVNLDQMLVGLYENNKEAFASGNINRLKVGQIIKVPSKESLTSINEKQVAQSVKAHSSNWSSYRNTLAGAVVASPSLETVEQKQTSSGKVETAVDKATLPKVGPQDVVKLSAGEKSIEKAGNYASKISEAKIIALQEETTARGKSLNEVQDRIAALETQIEDMRKLLALKSQSMATVQKNSEAAAKVEVKPEEKPADVVSAPEAQKSETAPPESVKSNEVVAVTPDKAPVALVLPPVIKKINPSKPEPAAEISFLQGLLNSVDLTVIGAVGGVALLGAGWMFLRNKRRKNLDSFERSILTSGGLRANTVFGNTTGNAGNSDTSFLTDFAQSADGSMIDTNDVDPIAEAEVYIAYGRDAQAEEILKDAISKEPKRYELHLKLLEMYATRKAASAFEAIAGELYTTLGVNDPIWAKVAEIGHNMEPENPLYDVTKSVAAAAIAAPKLDASDISSLPTTTDLDFSLDGHSTHDSLLAEDDVNSFVTKSFSSLQNVEQEMSSDLGSIEKNSLESKNALNSPQNNTQSVNTISFNSNADSSLDFDLGEFNMDAELARSASVPDEPLIIDNIDFASSEITSHEFSSPDLDFSKKEALANPTISA
ncbi:MAG: FimV family protein, partial [Methylophilaceae bacterium]|nr:FimV family protein [Methylophilaceae bacterium]